MSRSQELKLITPNKALAFLAAGVLISNLGVLVLLPLGKVSVDFGSFAAIYKLALILLPVIAFACWRKMSIVACSFAVPVLWLCLVLPTLFSTYFAIGLNLPLADNTLAAMDRAIGVNWPAMASFVNSIPALAWVLEFAYRTFGWQLLLIPLILCAIGNPVRACAMVLGYTAICFVSSIITAWYPAVGAFAYYDLQPQQFPNLKIPFSNYFLTEFHIARNAANPVVSIQQAEGIVSFPSVHAAVGVLCAWALWTTRLLRIPFLILNIAMILSAIFYGSHYVADIIAGIGVASISIAIVKGLFIEGAETVLEVRPVANLVDSLRSALSLPSGGELLDSGNPVACNGSTGSEVK